MYYVCMEFKRVKQKTKSIKRLSASYLQILICNIRLTFYKYVHVSSFFMILYVAPPRKLSCVMQNSDIMSVMTQWVKKKLFLTEGFVYLSYVYFQFTLHYPSEKELQIIRDKLLSWWTNTSLWKDWVKATYKKHFLSFYIT